MAKIAVKFDPSKPAGDTREQGALRSRILDQGQGWLVEEVICTAGPHDRPFEEQHSAFAIAMVLSGSFQYRTRARSCGAGELMTPGSLFLGNAGQHFECGHEHAAGDRCLSFRYSSDYFERLAADAGAGRGERQFPVPRLPVCRELSKFFAQAAAWLAGPSGDHSYDRSWEELSVELAAQVLSLSHGLWAQTSEASASTLARVTRAVRMIERNLSSKISLRELAQAARLSPFHFLRSFEQVTGTTPHQYVRRARLRAAATRLKREATHVLELAMDCGFGDVSNFNRAFRDEFGTTPLRFRRQDAS
ncbi:MAG TPA: AraC family transcriptional regulator [Candidatus Angelobacter sp.]|nr:AraC family transcriptional regulator [Candidatus Angelobacter sp.]